MGLLPLGIDALGRWSGIMLVVAGLLNIAVHALLPLNPYNMYMQGGAEDDEEDSERFEA